MQKYHQLSYSIISALKSCRSHKTLKQIHASLIVSNVHTQLASKLASLYIQYNDFDSSVSVLKCMKEPSTFLWNSVIRAHVNSGLYKPAFSAFKLMRQKGVSCDSYTFPIVAKLFVQLESCVRYVKMIHCVALQMGFESDVYFCNAMIDAYTRSGCFRSSLRVFEEMPHRDLVSWTSMISGYAYYEGSSDEVFRLFNEMRKEVEPNEVTMIVMSQTCNSLAQGRQLHCYVIKCGSLVDQSLKNSILKMYSDFGCIDELEILFEETDERDVVSWNIMMSSYSYAKSGDFENVIEFFKQMLASGVQHIITEEDIRVLVVTCMHIGALRLGKAVHGYSIKNFIFASQSLETCILNMYIRCGNVSSARICFDKMQVKDLVAWSSMIEGYSTHGSGDSAFAIFNQMKKEGIEPNKITFLSLLSACSHSGLLQKGCEALNSMKHDYNLEPDIDHYTCVVDMLGRSGNVKEALRVILKLVSYPDSRIWGALLAGARIHEDRKVCEYAVKKVIEMESDNVGYYTIYSNVEASVKRWDEVEEVRSGMKNKNLVKFPGWSCLEVGGEFHGFVSGDRSHHQIDEIYGMIECLSRNALDV